MTISSFIPPDLTAVLQQHKTDIMASLNCHQVGTIQAFNADDQTASISINMQRLVYNRPDIAEPVIITYPLLVKCPVFVLAGGGGYLTMPVAVGDTCMVLFNDRDIDAWWDTGNVVPPNTPRLHSISDGFALVGFRSRANKLSNYSTSDVELHSPGLVDINNQTTTLRLVLQGLVTALSSLDANKTGPSSAAAIAAAQALIVSLLK